MTVSFHGGHSGDYCDHAGGKLEELVKNAIAQGFTHYGLSEHMPRTRLQDLYPEEQQRNRTPEQLKNRFSLYIREARQLQYKYRHQIHLLVGMETEMIEDDFSTIAYFRQHYGVDYLVGSVHHVKGIPCDYGVQTFKKIETLLGSTEAVYCAYYDAQFQLMQHLQPEVIGHFDLIRLYRPQFPLSEQIWEKIKRNVAYAISYDAVFEINARAFKKDLAEPYPQATILELIHSMNGKLTLGDDAHHPDEVGLNYGRLFSFLHQHHIVSVYVLEKDLQGNLVKKIVPLPQNESD